MIFNVTSGGGGGGAVASLTVNAPAGCTVTVSKDGKTKTKVAGEDGVAVFKGLATGDWTVSISDGEQTAQKTVTITADYSTAITFFSATIHVTYPAGSTCTATDGVTTITAPDTSGTWECVVPNAGTWTVSLNSGFSETVTISDNGETKSIERWHLYSDGDERTSVTGGWSGSGYYYSPNGNMGSGTKKETYIDLYSTSAGMRNACGTVNAIDLTRFRQIKVKGKVLKTYPYHGEPYGIDVYVGETKDLNKRAVLVSVTETGDFEANVDIDKLSGNFYICCSTASIESIRGEIYRVSLC